MLHQVQAVTSVAAGPAHQTWHLFHQSKYSGSYVEQQQVINLIYMLPGGLNDSLQIMVPNHHLFCDSTNSLLLTQGLAMRSKSMKPLSFANMSGMGRYLK